MTYGHLYQEWKLLEHVATILFTEFTRSNIVKPRMFHKVSDQSNNLSFSIPCRILYNTNKSINYICIVLYEFYTLPSMQTQSHCTHPIILLFQDRREQNIIEKEVQI